MPLKRTSRLALPHVASALAFAALAWSGAAHADGKAACVASSTQGQSLRDAAKLKEARDQFVTCARDECPAIVRKYCADWLSDVERRLPSVVFRAQTAQGAYVTDARVTVDGELVAHALDGTAIPLNPGAHQVRYDQEGAAPIEQSVVIVEGERGRVLSARFPSKVIEPPPADAAAEPPRARPGRAVTPLTVVLGGLGVIGVAGFAYFGLTASSDLDSLRRTCAPFCAPSALASVKREALIADLSLGVGILSLGAAAYTFFARPSPPVTTATLVDIRPTPGGAFGTITARF